MAGKSKYILHIYIEQGSEGAHWSLYDTSKTGYDGLVDIYEGMKLEIVGVWKGTIKRNNNVNRQWYTWCEPYVKREDYRGLLEKASWETKELSNAECLSLAWQSFSQQVAGGYYCHWLPEGIDPDKWTSWFEDELEVNILE